jgi:hypothetical protein
LLFRHDPRQLALELDHVRPGARQNRAEIRLLGECRNGGQENGENSQYFHGLSR